MRENDTVLYFGEQFTVIELTGENATIKNDRCTYNVPQYMLQFVEHAEPVKKTATKKTSKK